MAKQFTEEEIKNNYEFKVIVRLLKREFPFIKDVDFKHNEDINRWPSTIYVNLDIDPFVLSQMYNIPVWDVISRTLKRGEPYWYPYLSIFFGGVERVEQLAPINNLIEKTISSVHRTQAIPHDMKLGKIISVGSFTADPSTVPPDMSSYPN